MRFRHVLTMIGWGSISGIRKSACSRTYNANLIYLTCSGAQNGDFHISSCSGAQSASGCDDDDAAPVVHNTSLALWDAINLHVGQFAHSETTNYLQHITTQSRSPSPRTQTASHGPMPLLLPSTPRERRKPRPLPVLCGYKGPFCKRIHVLSTSDHTCHL